MGPRRRINHLMFLLAALAVVALSGPALAQSRDVGRVVELQLATGAIVIDRVAGGPVPAFRFQHLFVGDEVVVEGNSKVIVRVNGVTTTVDRRSSPFPIRAPGGDRQANTHFLKGIAILLASGGSGSGISTSTYARADGQRSDAATPTGLQKLPEGVSAFALTWRGVTGQIELRGRDGELTTLNGAGDQAVRSSGAEVVEARLVGSELAWTFQHGGTAPIPPWFESSIGKLSDVDRIVRASWIIQEGPLEWRAFALGEIADLAGRNALAADLWDQAREGALGQLLASARAEQQAGGR